MYLAYSTRARSVSSVPLMMARPSANTVNSYASPAIGNRSPSTETCSPSPPPVAGNCFGPTRRSSRVLRPALADLHRVPAAQARRLGAVRPGEPLELPQGAARALRPLRPFSGAIFTRRVVFSHTFSRNSSRFDGGRLAGQNLQRLGRLVAGDDARRPAPGRPRSRTSRPRPAPATARTRTANTASRPGMIGHRHALRTRPRRRTPTACSSFTAVSLMRYRTSKLSVPSRI